MNNLLNSKNLVELVRAVGQEVANRAEDLVGTDENTITDFDIWLRFRNDEVPTIEVSRTHQATDTLPIYLKQWQA